MCEEGCDALVTGWIHWRGLLAKGTVQQGASLLRVLSRSCLYRGFLPSDHETMVFLISQRRIVKLPL